MDELNEQPTFKNKMNKFTYLIALISTTIFLTACGGGSSDSSVSVSATKVLAIGDSMGAGFGGTTPWPRLIQSKTGVAVVNNSVPGRQARGSAGLVQSELDTHKPSHLVILLGLNDANNGSIDSAVSSVRSMIEAARAANVIPIIATIPVTTADAGVAARSRDLSARYRSLGVAIAEVEGGFSNPSGLLQSDNFHPNNAGQEIIADAFISKL